MDRLDEAIGLADVFIVTLPITPELPRSTAAAWRCSARGTT